jgi:hypothetical protein
VLSLIQADSDAQLTANSGIGDMILIVPFIRNVYTVLAYEPPPFNTSVYAGIDLTLGLLGLNNITQALEEFNNLRIFNQPLSGSLSNQISPSSNENYQWASKFLLVSPVSLRCASFFLG